MTVYKREEFPEKYHYAKAVDRLGEIIVLPNDTETIFFTSKFSINLNLSVYFISQTMITNFNIGKGNHGYDNTLPAMQAIFIAQGPGFKQNMEINSLKNVDVYHIACKILNLTPNLYATAGSLENLKDIFRTNVNRSSKFLIDIRIIVFLVFINFLIQV